MLSLYDKIDCNSVKILEWQSLSGVLERMKNRFGMKIYKHKQYEFGFTYDPTLQLDIELRKCDGKLSPLSQNKRIKFLQDEHDKVEKYSIGRIELRLVQIIRRTTDDFSAKDFIVYANYGVGFFHNKFNYEGGEILIPCIVRDEKKEKIIDYLFVSIQIKKTKNKADIGDVRSSLSGIDAPNITIDGKKVKCFPIVLFFSTGLESGDDNFANFHKNSFVLTHSLLNCCTDEFVLCYINLNNIMEKSDCNNDSSLLSELEQQTENL